VGLPDRAGVEALQRCGMGREFGEPAQPDEPIRAGEVAKLAGDVHPVRLLALHERLVEDPDQLVPQGAACTTSNPAPHSTSQSASRSNQIIIQPDKADTLCQRSKPTLLLAD
jgi:hypothetical protein